LSQVWRIRWGEWSPMPSSAGSSSIPW